MATKKERVVFYVSEEVKRKLSKLAEAENRSLSNWLENLSLKEINNRWAEESEESGDRANFNDSILI